MLLLRHLMFTATAIAVTGASAPVLAFDASDCQAAALTSIAKNYRNVLRGQFEIILKDNRCLLFLQAPAIYEGKYTAWLIDGITGDLLAEFYAPKAPGRAWSDKDKGLCTFRSGKFPT